jgi:spoIIIJ-associated protein
MHDTVETILKDLLSAMGVMDAKVSRSELAGQTIFSIQSESDGRSLIGAHGDTVHAIDMIVKKIAEKKLTPEDAENLHFLVDVNGYRAKQIQDLQTKALMMAERARSFQYDVELSPMSAYERLIVHTTLQNAPNVKTESLGEGRNRRVVIKYAA